MLAAVSSVEVRDACRKKASQLRTAKARPVGDAPAFMISGRVPPTGFGLARMPLSLRYWPSKSKSDFGDQICLIASIHSCAYS